MVGDEIVEALGLTDHKVRKVTINCEVGCVTVVEAELVLDLLDESGEELLTELRRYELVEREEGT